LRPAHGGRRLSGSDRSAIARRRRIRATPFDLEESSGRRRSGANLIATNRAEPEAEIVPLLRTQSAKSAIG
jgi:hypothetical protein